MANALYQDARRQFLAGTLGWGGTIKVALIDSAIYTVDLVNHISLADVDASSRVAISDALTGVVALTDGVADADDITLYAVTGSSFEYMLIYQEGVSEALSPLILLLDTVSGMPVAPNGTNISIVWDNGANRIFKL